MAASATPLSGVFFRAVEFRWMHPDDVMSGAGTAKLGGRFASGGNRALYVLDSEETCSRKPPTLPGGWQLSSLTGGGKLSCPFGRASDSVSFRGWCWHECGGVHRKH